MEKFRLTNWGNAIWVEGGEVGTSIYGIRKTDDGVEELFITITIGGIYPPRVVFRYHLGDALHEQVIKSYTDIVEMMQGIKKYIEEKEKQKDMEDYLAGY